MRLATALTADVKEFAKDNGFAEINNILKGSYKDYTVLTNSKINEIEEISSSFAEQCADHARKQPESKYMSMMLMYNRVCVGTLFCVICGRAKENIALHVSTRIRALTAMDYISKTNL